MPGTAKDDDKLKIAPIDKPNDPPVTDPDKVPPVDDDVKPKDTDDKIVPDKFLDKDGQPDVAKMAKAYTELETKLGESGTEKTGLKQERDGLKTQIDELTKKAAGDDETKTDVQVQLDDLQKQLEEGEITIPQFTAKQGKLLTEIAITSTLVATEEQAKNRDLNRQAGDAEDQWLKDNPDFQKVVDSGVLDEIKKENPLLHDNFVAYKIYMAQQSFAEGKAEAEADKIKKGADLAGDVLQDPGLPKRSNTGQTSLTQEQIEAKQHQTLKKMRGEA